jgi:hypothetical protein
MPEGLLHAMTLRPSIAEVITTGYPGGAAVRERAGGLPRRSPLSEGSGPSAPAQKTAGSVAALIDQLRDAVSGRGGNTLGK